MDLTELGLLLSTLLVSLVGGFLWAFALVVMPGIQSLNDRDFLGAFKVMDGVIQRNHPLFILVWLGSVVSIVLAAGLGSQPLLGQNRWLLLLATALYLLAVQLPTLRVNVPLNNELQARDLDSLDANALNEARRRFEQPWTRWNTFRTGAATIVTCLLLTVLVRL